jgi:hypothetical protein
VNCDPGEDVALTSANQWGKSYKRIHEDLVKKVSDGELNALEMPVKLWREWVHENFKGIQIAPPWTTSPEGDLELKPNDADKDNFGPLDFATPGLPPASAAVIATAWETYCLSLVWKIPSPQPPFSSILTVTIDPATMTAAKAALISSLVAEFAIAPVGDFDVKYFAIGTIVHTACAALGVILAGTDTNAAPITVPSPVQ